MSVSLLSYALTTLAKVKLALGIASSDTTYDDVLNTYINEVTGFIEGYCGGRRFARTTYTNEIYDSFKRRTVFLRNFPIASDQTGSGTFVAKYRSGTIMSPTWITYDGNSYLVYLKSGYVKFYAILPEVSQALSFTYEAGYLIDFTAETDTTKHTLPFDLTRVATEIVAKAYNMKAAGGIYEMQTEGQTVKFSNKAQMVTDDQDAILKNYSVLKYAV